MFDFLKSRRPKNGRPFRVASDSAIPSSTRQDDIVRDKLIRVVMKDTLRLHGIPSKWLACEIMTIARTPDDEELHIQLIVMKWNEQLLRYAYALQHQMLLGLDRIEPSAGHSRCIVSWRFSPDCGCPFDRMPDPKFWSKSVMPQVDEEPIPVLDRRHARRPPDAPTFNPPLTRRQPRPPRRVDHSALFPSAPIDKL